ncbi:conserved hypothetical protein [Bacillus sp. IT-79MI2]|nr:hypothetical protein BTH41_00166 [Bacillus mycoides]
MLYSVKYLLWREFYAYRFSVTFNKNIIRALPGNTTKPIGIPIGFAQSP